MAILTSGKLVFRIKDISRESEKSVTSSESILLKQEGTMQLNMKAQATLNIDVCD